MPNQDEKNSSPAEEKKDIKPAAPKAKAKAKKPAAPKAETKAPLIEGDFVIMENKAGQRHYCTRAAMEAAKEITGKAYDWKQVSTAKNSQDAIKMCQK